MIDYINLARYQKLVNGVLGCRLIAFSYAILICAAKCLLLPTVSIFPTFVLIIFRNNAGSCLQNN